MKVYNIYSENFSIFIRCVAIIASIILISSNIFRLLGVDGDCYSINNTTDFLLFLFNCTSIFLCFILTIFPKKIIIITILSFFISVICFFDYSNPMAILMFFLGYNTLLARGFYSKHKKQKYIFTLLFFFLLWLISLRFGLVKFLIGILLKAAYSFITILAHFFFVYYLHIQEERKQETVLNIAKYHNLDSRDAKILKMIVMHIKYDAIAPEVNLGLGALKNRLKIIYNTLEVGDKHGFLNKYDGFDIIYTT